MVGWARQIKGKGERDRDTKRGEAVRKQDRVSKTAIIRLRRCVPG